MFSNQYYLLIIFYLIILPDFIVFCRRRQCQNDNNNNNNNKYFETFFIENNEEKLNQNIYGRNAIKSDEYKWPNGIVPYFFDNNYSQNDRLSVEKAIWIFHNETCVKFVPKNNNNIEHIKFVKSEGSCGSYIGCRPNRTEPLNVFLSKDCINLRAAIQHELLHVLGLLHEQCRPDRDEHINIFWDNIDPQYKSNFNKGSPNSFETFDLPYDYDSLMHYPKNAFSKSEKLFTMESKIKPNQTLGQTNGPTYFDMEKIRRMYNC